MNEKEWLEWRQKGIGASESPIIMGVSRFKTAKELWEQKIDPTPPTQEKNFITEKGHRLEAIARKNYELETFCQWPAKMLEWEQNPRIRCSLDGWNDGRVWECKYLGWDKYQALRAGEIPEEYYPQLMHQCLVSGATEIHLTGIIDNKVNKSFEAHQTEQYTLVHKLNDDDLLYIRDELLPAIEKFIECVDTKTEPQLTEKDTEDLSEDNELKSLLNRYLANKKILDRAKRDEKKLKDSIFDRVKKTNRAVCGSFSLTRSVQKAKKIPDFEAYCTQNKIAVDVFKDKKEVVTQKISVKK